MIIHYSESAKETIWRYYEKYKTTYKSGYPQNDMEQRANVYRQIANTLYYLNHYLDQTYVAKGKNFIDIGNVASVEFEIENNRVEIIVKNIILKRGQQGLWYPNKKNSNQVNNKYPNKKVLSDFYYGWRKIEVNNFYNLENKQGKLFNPKWWYSYIGDFKESSDEVNAQRNGKNYSLDLQTGYEIDPSPSTGYTVENKKKEQKLYINEEVIKSLEFMWRLIEYRFW